MKAFDKMEDFEGHLWYIKISKNMNIELVRCLVKSIHVLLCPNVTVTYLGASWHPSNLLKPLKTTQKHDINEDHRFFGFLTPHPL